ncbi:hypothetical protein PR003_g1662 [Phytophthora rubi]|uniref:Uncharacterized protein n=1 Tax=Phytophthora rubi TaxID=129364 RepID=A0A6A4G0C3_9STRA|nr:hypothetical protein PR002_g3962 [Phytophthora rubi]KAE9047878.1 hypothetical protein PR001_g4023 [Phytophthora rubi]KAE9357720.1 hypothetical protein PR003_g1662 [Phytophthora rubi]
MMKLLTVSALVISVSASEDFTALQHHVSPVLAASNLLDSDDFFVCDSKVPGMNGHYVLQSSNVVQSDPDTPVFFREDSDDDGEQFTAVALAADTATDFRLFRHNGFWMLADVEPWPPVTHFRCDPTKTQIIGVDVTDVCGLGQSTPPRIGYSPADPKLGDFSLTLHRHGCQELLETEDQDVKSSRNNFSTRKEEL